MLALKLLILPFLFGISLLTTVQETQPVEVKAFQVDTVHSTAIFKVHHRGAGMFYGRFNDVTGTINADGSSPLFDISIDVNSVDTNNSKLDAHLKSPDFFNTVEYPVMTFKSLTSKKVVPIDLEGDLMPSDEKYEVAGEITLHGVTKPLTVLMVKTGEVEGRRGELIGFETEFVLDRSEFGMTYGVESGALGNQVKIIVAIEAIR